MESKSEFLKLLKGFQSSIKIWISSPANSTLVKYIGRLKLNKIKIKQLISYSLLGSALEVTLRFLFTKADTAESYSQILSILSHSIWVINCLTQAPRLTELGFFLHVLASRGV